MRKIIDNIAIALVCVNILYVFAGVLFYPLQSEDAIGIWFFKAKAFYLANGFPNAFLHNLNYAYSHQQYPLGLPFVFFLIYKIVGGVKENIILFLYPLAYIAIVFLAYKILRRVTSKTHALVFTYIYSMLPPLIASAGRILAGGADIFIVLIEWIILFILYKKRLSNWNYLSLSLLIALATQIKQEGVFLTVFLLFLPVSKKLKLLLVSIALAPFFIWTFAVHLLNIPSDIHYAMPSGQQLINNFFIIVIGICKEFININNWYLFWILIFLSTLIKVKVSSQMKFILVPSYITIMVLFISVYLFSTLNTESYVSSSFDRVLLQHSAIAFLFFFEKINAIDLNFLFLFKKSNFIQKFP